MHALIIEDEPVIAMMIEDELRDLGYRSFDVACDEEQAVRLAERTCPALITADDRLTTGTGIGAVRRICAETALPVVFITGNPHELGIPDAVCLAKPFGAADFQEAVQRAARSAQTYA